MNTLSFQTCDENVTFHITLQGYYMEQTSATTENEPSRSSYEFVADSQELESDYEGDFEFAKSVAQDNVVVQNDDQIKLRCDVMELVAVAMDFGTRLQNIGIIYKYRWKRMETLVLNDNINIDMLSKIKLFYFERISELRLQAFAYLPYSEFEEQNKALE